MQNAKSQAVHDLICNMLRGLHIRKMAGADLARYTYKAGVALHNLPFVLTGDQALTEGHLLDVNELDPHATSGAWGPWTSSLSAAFGLALPVAH
ncbi:hypothetical protein [Azonexus hydrophilus]|uniref:Uncharacterized protein n=1 Tax=Azonexus hydrophilus TaxID=418702 RepID=A0ABZ2XL46_9RHOO